MFSNYIVTLLRTYPLFEDLSKESDKYELNNFAIFKIYLKYARILKMKKNSSLRKVKNMFSNYLSTLKYINVYFKLF